MQTKEQPSVWGNDTEIRKIILKHTYTHTGNMNKGETHIS